MSDWEQIFFQLIYLTDLISIVLIDVLFQHVVRLLHETDSLIEAVIGWLLQHQWNNRDTGEKQIPYEVYYLGENF